MSCDTKNPSISAVAIGPNFTLPNEQMGMDIAAFDNVVRGKGIPLIHYRALRCPVGLVDPSDLRRTHADHSGCSNGFIYKAMGRVTTTLTSNATQIQKLDMGYFDGSTIVATFPRQYDSDTSKAIMVRPYDRFYLEQEDIVTATWMLTSRRMDDRTDQLEFPAVAVENLIDSDNVEYHQFVDFDIAYNGDIRWRTDKGPQPGQVYSVWFTYRPYWYCERMLHDIRVYPVFDFADTRKVTLERNGSQAVLQREYVHRTSPPEPEAPVATRDRQKPPPDGDDFLL